jgi:hypothetical protein
LEWIHKWLLFSFYSIHSIHSIDNSITYVIGK